MYFSSNIERKCVKWCKQLKCYHETYKQHIPNSLKVKGQKTYLTLLRT